MILGKEQRICLRGKGEVSQVLRKDFRGTSVVNATFDYQPLFLQGLGGVGTNSTFGKENVTIQNALHKLFDKRKADGSHAKSIMKKVSFDTKTSHLCSAIWFKVQRTDSCSLIEP